MARSVAFSGPFRDIDNYIKYAILLTFLFAYLSPASLRIIPPVQMTTRSKIVTTALLLLVLTGVGAADYYFAGREYAADLGGQQPVATGTGVGVPKADGVNVQETLSGINIATQVSEDLTFLAQVSRNAPVQSLVILENGDRAGSVSWIDGDSKSAFIALKEALLSAFSANVQGLSDTTLQEEGKPTRNVLTFRDPALSEETLTFVRVRERLYEFHTAGSGSVAVQQAIEALTTR